MSLKEYRSKRNLKVSPEPKGKAKRSSAVLNFCVQKHAARRLHYDFRLEYQGKLLSWAVPKELSLDSKDKRLAIRVEDHPLEYQYFEGVIPKGNYGAGTVEIWDHGTYTVPDDKSLTDGLQHGHFSVILSGEKLNGEFIFQKLKKNNEADRNWLVIKKEDDFSNTNPAPKKAARMPSFVLPMLATLVDAPFDDEDWLFEMKWDGYRSLAFIDNGKVNLKSRTGQIWNNKFAPIVQNLKKIKGKVILDGELVILDEEGKSHFQLMQNYHKEGDGALYYYVFDLLYQEGQDLRERPLIERKHKLQQLLQEHSFPIVRYSDHIIGKGIAFFKEVSKKNLEGIIGKKIYSQYESKRSRDWVKIKVMMKQEVVIGGFTEPKGSRKNIGALLVGVYNEDKQLLYSGHVGGGFTTKLLQDVYRKLAPLTQSKCPFLVKPQANAPVTWVKPKLVCEVSFTEWTKDQSMRHPIFQGLREDKLPETISREFAEKSPTKKKFSVSNTDKIYWPKERYTKGDLLQYYEKVSPYILPYLKNRPIMLHRYPEGIEGQNFYQKDLGESHPAWVKICPIKQGGKINHYLLINNLRSLLYAVNLGSIDLHPFMSRCKSLDTPDYCVIDFDPWDVPTKKLMEIVLYTHEVLTDVQVPHYCKTSGGKGIHLLIPLHAKYDFDQSKNFSLLVASIIHNQFPDIASLERSPKKRTKKVYLDCLQNRFGQTLAAPYTVRPRPFATVSTPLAWDEIDLDLDLTKFNIKTVINRLEQQGDPFKSVLGRGISMSSALDKLNKFIK